MRTTVTLDADTAALVRKRMRTRGVSFKQALNDLIRDGMAATSTGPSFRTTTARLGVPTVNLDQALRLAAELEEEELVRKMRTGK